MMNHSLLESDVASIILATLPLLVPIRGYNDCRWVGWLGLIIWMDVIPGTAHGLASHVLELLAKLFNMTDAVYFAGMRVSATTWVDLLLQSGEISTESNGWNEKGGGFMHRAKG